MRIRRVLILAPLGVLAVLLQSAFWVPTFEDQARGNPARLTMFVDATTGDARLLNPILAADSVSSQVVGYVFDSLLDLDEELQLRPRIARRYAIRERVVLVERPGHRLPDGKPATAEALAARFRSVRAGAGGTAAGPLPQILEAVEVLPPETLEVRVEGPAGEGGVVEEVRVPVRAPARVRLRLSRVDPEFRSRLPALVGPGFETGFDPLAAVDPPSEELREPLRARLAELLPAVAERPVIEFELRRGVRFHDGVELDAGDVRFTWQAVMDPKNLSPRVSDFEPILDIEIDDPYHLRVVYKRLFSPAIYPWSYMGILPEHRLNREQLLREMQERGLSEQARAAFGLRDSRFNRHPIGSGRFRFAGWEPDEVIHVEANPDYFEGPPEFRHVFLRIIPDLLTQEFEFRSGAVDAYGALPWQAARYRDDPRFQYFSSIGFGYTYIGYNHRRKPFDDPRVRRALGMAIDTDAIIRYVLYGEGVRITGPYAVNTRWYDPEVPPLPYDPEGALRILREAGFERNEEGWLERDGEVLRFTLITNNGNPTRKAILTIVQDAWRRIGIDCRTQLFEWAVFLKDFVNKGDFDALVLGWSMGVDPDLYQIWHSSQAGPQQLNFVGYVNPEVDRLIEAIRAEYDEARQEELAHRLHRLIAEDQPYTFLFAPKSTLVLDRKIVIVERDDRGREVYRKPYATRRGTMGDYFHKLRKLPRVPVFDRG